ncbi:hypothetical protein B0H13DRAFT_2337265 [Mycena leptocephala]|nr:hypothetical protein B0H13DRAFT_2337265 [Mycena leptocephala]
MAAQPTFKRAIAELNAQRPVMCYMFDEGYHYHIDEDFHKNAFQGPFDLRQIDVQAVLVSATIPPAAQAYLTQQFVLVNPLCISSTSHQQDGWAIIKDFGLEFYHADSDTNPITDSEQIGRYQRWLSGQYRGLGCTTALAAGTNYAHVRLTIHIGLPQHATMFKQQAEWAGCDGRITWNFIIPCKGTQPRKVSKQDDLAGQQFMWDFVFGKKECYTLQMTGFMDGIPCSCADLQHEFPCDPCKDAGVQPGSKAVIAKPQNPSLLWSGPVSPRSVKCKLKEAFGNATEVALQKTGKKACVRPEAISTLQAFLNRVGQACGFCFVAQSERRHKEWRLNGG